MRSVDWRSLFPNILAGLTTGLVTLVYSISFAALIFSGSLTPYFPQGVGIALIGAMLTAFIVARHSGFSYALAGPESNSAVIVALMAATIATSLESMPSQIYPTVWATVSLSTLVTGLFLFTVGRLRLGNWARFIPYPVIGGFLAGTGWLITHNSFKVMTGLSLDWTSLPQFMQSDNLYHWLAGLIFAIALFVILRHYQQFWVLPSLLAGGIIGCHVLFWLLQQSQIPVTSDGWFFAPFSNAEVWPYWQGSTVTQINWPVVLHQSGTLVALMLVVIISILLNATGLEQTTSRTIDLNQELRVNGLANLVNGCCGGMIGYLSINRTLLNFQAGGSRPLAGIIAAALCGSVLLFGASFLAYLPKPILGGLLLYIGLTLLTRWLYRAWFLFNRLDYCLILLILLVIAVWGFLPGIAAGLAIACFLFIARYSSSSAIKYTASGRAFRSHVRRSTNEQTYLKHHSDAIYILVLQGFIFFGTANTLFETVRQRLQDASQPALQFVVLDFRLVTGLDSSVVMSLTKLNQLAQKAGFQLLFTQLDVKSQHQIEQGGAISSDDSVCHFFPDLDRGLEWCEIQLIEASKLRRRRFVPLVLQLKTQLPDPDRAALLVKYLKPLHLEANEHLFHQGELFNGLYFLESGRISVIQQMPDNKVKRLRTYTGGVIGETGLYQRGNRTASAIAEQASSLYYLSIEAFDQMELEEPLLAASFHKFVIGLLTEQIDYYEQELNSLLQ